MNPRKSRRQFIRKLATDGAGVSLLPAALQTATAADSARPNIVYIHSHDSGRYLQPYGYPVPTPNLQRLASEGVLFRRAFSAAPTCSPSRAALLTGQCAHQNGMTGLAHRGFTLNDYKQHIVHTLRTTGYTSALAGVQHVAAKPDTIGYDEVLRPRTTSAIDVAPGAVAFLDRKPKQPFFLDVGFFETHREYPKPTAADDPRYLQPPVPVPDTPETRLDMAGYHASARILDDGIGKVLGALERNGLAANTLVISTTDHGVSFPLMKCNLEDFGWGVSLIMRGPNAFQGGKVSDSLISQLDIFPTVCELLAIAKPAWLQGKSMLPVLTGVTQEINDEVFAEVNYHAAYEPKRAVRTHRWKYIRRYGERKTPVLPNCDDGLSKTVWLKHGWQDHQLPAESLYDLVFDPTEHHNLVADPSAQEVLTEMRARLDRWMKNTDDPLLKGPVPAPHGAQVNDPSGISPKEQTQVVA
ncbi:MAG: N-sulfoglucosamine sulfohydrolase [Bryobacterales bacterium]|jgi:arylsulfatase A-like enzyme|nr:N-sulfoglucosamine sulfohydrolase [Bryobacterales bacterium]